MSCRIWESGFPDPSVTALAGLSLKKRYGGPWPALVRLNRDPDVTQDFCGGVFLSLCQILKVSKVADRTQSIFEDAFSTLGRLDNISVVMGFHPHYLESFLRTQHYLLQMDGPLSLHYRHYIGIMVLLVPFFGNASTPPFPLVLWVTPLFLPTAGGS